MRKTHFTALHRQSGGASRQPRAIVIAAVAALGLFSAGGAKAGEIEYFSSKGNLPFSEAVRAGDFLYLSGQIGSATGSDAAAAFSAAARDAMDRISAVLVAHGSDFDHVVQCTVMLADMKTWAAFNEIYATYFKAGRLPSRNAFGANGLAHDAPLEVSCVAYQPATREVKPPHAAGPVSAPTP
jgi:reactive intermediate/imine deaminase